MAYTFVGDEETEEIEEGKAEKKTGLAEAFSPKTQGKMTFSKASQATSGPSPDGPHPMAKLELTVG